MFSLQNQKAKLSSVNPRSEIHGTEHVMAADLKFEIKTSNDVLSEFDPSLKAALYEKGSPTQGQLIDEPGNLPALKFLQMGPISWSSEFSGYRLIVHYGINAKTDIELDLCEVDKFVFEPMDGGTVLVRFRVIAHPESLALGRLCEMIQQEVEISLIEPEAEADPVD